ncbi:hypothetical protein CI102_1657 [Trichoderma harzianum]|nr:hypothetical protein CI102_1657 [Trichoderma harzianum]
MCAVFESSEWSPIIQYYTRACVTVHMPQSIGMVRIAVKFVPKCPYLGSSYSEPRRPWNSSVGTGCERQAFVYLQMHTTYLVVDTWFLDHISQLTLAKWTGWGCCTTSCFLASCRLINPPHKGVSPYLSSPNTSNKRTYGFNYRSRGLSPLEFT